MKDEQLKAMIPECNRCIYWHMHEGPMGYGDCRYGPPRTTQQSDGKEMWSVTEFPKTAGTCGCGHGFPYEGLEYMKEKR
jgi:hypothetical protein